MGANDDPETASRPLDLAQLRDRQRQADVDQLDAGCCSRAATR